jgi:hypothetical protein
MLKDGKAECNHLQGRILLHTLVSYLMYHHLAQRTRHLPSLYRLDNEFENGPVEPYAHYQNGVAERANRAIRERTAPIVQETLISRQVSKIISEKGTELLRILSGEQSIRHIPARVQTHSRDDQAT